MGRPERRSSRDCASGDGIRDRQPADCLALLGGEKDLEELNKFVNSLWSLYDARGWYHATVALTNDLLKVLTSTVHAGASGTGDHVANQLARALLATKGYTEEAEQAYRRALELCESAGEIPQLFPVLRGLASFYGLRNEPDKATQMGERILQLAERLDDTNMKIEGLLMTGKVWRSTKIQNSVWSILKRLSPSIIFNVNMCGDSVSDLILE